MKISVKQSYRLVEYLSVKTRALIDLSRPLTLIAAFLVGYAGLFMSTGYHHVPVTSKILVHGLMMSVAMAFAQGGGQAYNQAYDHEIDAEAKPHRPIPQGVLTVESAMTFGVYLFIASLITAFAVDWLFGALTALIIAVAIAYSAPPMRFKKRLWLNNAAQATTRGYLAIVACWSVYGSIFDLQPHLIGLGLFVFLLGAQSVKDIPDVVADGHHDIRTLPVVYGVSKTVLIMLPFLYLPYAFLALFIRLGWLPPQARAVLGLVGLSVFMTYDLLKYRGYRLNLAENNVSWILMYSTLAAWFVWFAWIFSNI